MLITVTVCFEHFISYKKKVSEKKCGLRQLQNKFIHFLLQTFVTVEIEKEKPCANENIKY